MQIELKTDSFHHMFVKDMLTQEERKDMLAEISMINKMGIFMPPEYTGTARHNDGTIKKSNDALAIDSVYAIRDASPTLTANRRLFDVLASEEAKESWFFNNVETCADTTFISYYENGDYYEAHQDKVMITAVSWLFHEPKKFKGGKISFPDFGIEFEVDNRTTIIFPSNTRHEVSEIIMDEEDLGKGLGRYCMSQFVSSC